MKKQWQKAAALLQKPWGLAAVCYAAALAGWLLYGVFCFGSDGLAAVRGSLRHSEAGTTPRSSILLLLLLF